MSVIFVLLKKKEKKNEVYEPIASHQLSGGQRLDPTKTLENLNPSL